MTDSELQSAFFDKGIQSIKLALTLLTETKLKEHQSSAIGELFHGYELLLKSSIAKHNKYLLVQDTKSIVVNDWKIESFNSLFTKNANELPKLLFALEEASDSVLFIKDQNKLIEKMRTERNRYEHGAATVTKGYISLVLAPFFHKVILRLIEFNGRKYKEVFPDEERLELFGVVDNPHEMLHDPNKFFEEPRSCPSCLNGFSFLSKTKDILHCLVCNEDVVTGDVRFRDCPICSGEVIAFDYRVECLGECRKAFKDEEEVARGQKCKCGSTSLSSICDETGDEDGICLECLCDLETMWRCDSCRNFRVNEEKAEPPEELRGDNLCEDCEQDVRAAYEPH